jgi:hypothetical protein
MFKKLRNCPEVPDYTVPSSVCEREWGVSCKTCKFSVNKYNSKFAKISAIILLFISTPIYAHILMNFN